MPRNKKVSIWNGWFGRTTVELTIDDEGFGVIDENAKRAFQHGQCHALAIAISQMTGWPIKGMGRPNYDEPDSPQHCVVWSPTLKKYVDINGVSTKPMLNSWRIINRRISRKKAPNLQYYMKPDMKAAIPFAKTILRDLNQLQPSR